MAGVFQNIDPPHRPASVYPPPLVRGEDTLPGRRWGEVGVNILEDVRHSSVPEIIDPVFAKTRSKRSFSMTEYERFGLVFAKTRVYKFGHCTLRM
jgi:hypothetical protein